MIGPYQAIITRPKKVYLGNDNEENIALKDPLASRIKTELMQKGILINMPTIALRSCQARAGFKNSFLNAHLIILSSPSGAYFFYQSLLQHFPQEEDIKKHIRLKSIALLGSASKKIFENFFGEHKRIILPNEGNENGADLAKVLITLKGKQGLPEKDRLLV